MPIYLGFRKADAELPAIQHLLSILIDRVPGLNSKCGTIASKTLRSCRPIFSVLLISTFAPPFSPPGGRDKQRRYQARPNAGLAVLHSLKQAEVMYDS